MRSEALVRVRAWYILDARPSYGPCREEAFTPSHGLPRLVQYVQYRERRMDEIGCERSPLLLHKPAQGLLTYGIPLARDTELFGHIAGRRSRAIHPSVAEQEKQREQRTRRGPSQHSRRRLDGGGPDTDTPEAHPLHAAEQTTTAAQSHGRKSMAGRARIQCLLDEPAAS